MGLQIVKQPDGKWAIWSTFVDAFAVIDATRGEIIEYFVKKAVAEVEEATRCRMEDIDNEDPYTMKNFENWDSCLRTVVWRGDKERIDWLKQQEVTKDVDWDGLTKKIEEEMATVLRGDTDVRHLFEAHHRKWKRRARAPINPTVRTDVEFEEKGDYTIIDVYAPDSVGFLYRVTETISRLGLDIYFAKIATRLDGIVDAFYVQDRSGLPLRNPGRRGEIRAEILRTGEAERG